MPTERVSILVSRETRDWLAAEVARLVADAERPGGYQCPAYRETCFGGKPPISLEAMLLILLDERQRHRERRRAAKLRRRLRGAGADVPQLGPGAAQPGHAQADGGVGVRPSGLPGGEGADNV